MLVNPPSAVLKSQLSNRVDESGKSSTAGHGDLENSTRSPRLNPNPRTRSPSATSGQCAHLLAPREASWESSDSGFRAAQFPRCWPGTGERSRRFGSPPSSPQKPNPVQAACCCVGPSYRSLNSVQCVHLANLSLVDLLKKRVLQFSRDSTKTAKTEKQQAPQQVEKGRQRLQHISERMMPLLALSGAHTKSATHSGAP